MAHRVLRGAAQVLTLAALSRSFSGAATREELRRAVARPHAGELPPALAEIAAIVLRPRQAWR